MVASGSQRSEFTVPQMNPHNLDSASRQLYDLNSQSYPHEADDYGHAIKIVSDDEIT